MWCVGAVLGRHGRRKGRSSVMRKPDIRMRSVYGSKGRTRQKPLHRATG